MRPRVVFCFVRACVSRAMWCAVLRACRPERAAVFSSSTWGVVRVFRLVGGTGEDNRTYKLTCDRMCRSGPIDPPPARNRTAPTGLLFATGFYARAGVKSSRTAPAAKRTATPVQRKVVAHFVSVRKNKTGRSPREISCRALPWPVRRAPSPG